MQGEADVEEDIVDEGRRQLQWQGPRRRGGVVLDGRRGGADSLAGTEGWRGLQGGRGHCAGKSDGGASRQWLLTPPDRDEGGLSENGAERRREACGQLQWGVVDGRGPWHCCSARGGRKLILIPDVLYVPGVKANLLSAGQLQESARYTSRVLCTDLQPCSTRSPLTKVVAMRAIVLATKSTLDRWHARLAHVGVDTIKSSAKHDIAIGLDIKRSTGPDLPCVSCVGGKLARHTFLDKGSDAEEALAVVHIDFCGPFRVAAKDGSLYFLLLKDRHTRFVWVTSVAKKSYVPRVFEK
ncbi:unnamed protein product [Closterium sp. NIES-53]